MSKKEIRQDSTLLASTAGDLSLERLELSKVQSNYNDEDLGTITVGCTELLTILCC